MLAVATYPQEYLDSAQPRFARRRHPAEVHLSGGQSRRLVWARATGSVVARGEANISLTVALESGFGFEIC
jgi:hypothetical protein